MKLHLFVARLGSSIITEEEECLHRIEEGQLGQECLPRTEVVECLDKIEVEEAMALLRSMEDQPLDSHQ